MTFRPHDIVPCAVANRFGLPGICSIVAGERFPITRRGGTEARRTIRDFSA